MGDTVLGVPVILMLISLKTELIFGIGPDNTYFRGPGKHESAGQLFKEVDGKMYRNKESAHS